MAAMKPPRDSDDVTGEGPSVLPGDLVRALAWLRQRLDQPVRLDALAEVAGVRPRTLENHFRTFLGTTPLGWVRRTRLHNARRALLEAREQSVTTAALANGFNQLGRFAAQARTSADGRRPVRAKLGPHCSAPRKGDATQPGLV